MSGENKKDVVVAIKAKDEFSDIMNRFKDSVHGGTGGVGSSGGEASSGGAEQGYGAAACCNANSMMPSVAFGGADGELSDGAMGAQAFGVLGDGGFVGNAGEQAGGSFDGSATLIAEEEARVREEQTLLEEEYVTPGTEGMTEIERYNFENQLKLIAMQEHNEQALDIMDASGAAQADLERKYSDMKKQYSEDERNYKIRNAVTFANTAMGLMQTIYTATGSQNKKMFKMMQAYAIGQAVVSGWQSAVFAWQAGMATGGPWAPLVAVAYTAASLIKTGSMIASIKSQKIGGSGSTGGGGGGISVSGFGGGSGSMPQRLNEPEEKQTQQITMNIYNPLSEQNWAEIAENNIIPALNDASDRNINLTVKTIAA